MILCKLEKQPFGLAVTFSRKELRQKQVLKEALGRGVGSAPLPHLRPGEQGACDKKQAVWKLGNRGPLPHAVIRFPGNAKSVLPSLLISESDRKSVLFKWTEVPTP